MKYFNPDESTHPWFDKCKDCHNDMLSQSQDFKGTQHLWEVSVAFISLLAVQTFRESMTSCREDILYNMSLRCFQERDHTYITLYKSGVLKMTIKNTHE